MSSWDGACLGCLEIGERLSWRGGDEEAGVHRDSAGDSAVRLPRAEPGVSLALCKGIQPLCASVFLCMKRRP